MNEKESQKHLQNCDIETVWYWPKSDMILVLIDHSDGTRTWQCDDNNLYWSDILDHQDEFVLLGDL
jgi:hypothetical protein